MWLAIIAAISLAASPASAQEAEKPTRVFGFLPIVSPEMLVRRFEPLVEYLAAEIGARIILESAPNYAEFVRRTHQDQRYDYLFTAPHFYYSAQREAGYRVLARVDGPLMRAVVVARDDSGIAKPRDLCGAIISTPDPLALGTILVRQSLEDAGCDLGGDTVLIATPSHNASLYSAYRGASDAAGLMTTPLARADPDVRSRMRVILETRKTPNMPFSVAPWVPDEEAAKFTRALIALKSSEEGRALLAHLSWPGFIGANPEEYDVFEEFSGDAFEY